MVVWCWVQGLGLRVLRLEIWVENGEKEYAQAWDDGSYLRLIDSCITQLKAQGPSRTCNESIEVTEHAQTCYEPVAALEDMASPHVLRQSWCFHQTRRATLEATQGQTDVNSHTNATSKSQLPYKCYLER